MTIELKINNPQDWAVLYPLLQRLKIAFIEKHEEQTAIVEEPKTFYTTKDKKLETILQSAEVAYIWSPYDAYEAADILADVLENHKKNTN